MKVIRLACLVSVLINLPIRHVFAQHNVKRVVIIGLDGFSVDGFSVEGFKTAKHPNLDKMIADGVYL